MIKKTLQHAILLLVMATTLPVTVNAQQISVSDAMSRAKTFLNRSKVRRAPAQGTQVTTTDLTLAYTAEQDGKVLFYVFNRADGNGYVIMGGDERANEVLGYTDSGAFDINQIPDAMRDMLGCYSADIDYAIKNDFQPATAARKARRAAAVTKQSITPLIQTKWNQTKPFYDAIPKLGELNMYTGCVATATAQIMKFWQYPTKGTGSHSYNWRPYIDGQDTQSDTEMTFSADFASTTYDWNNMLDEYVNEYGNWSDIGWGYKPQWNTTQGNAVATLMYHLGVAMEMNYGTTNSAGSGASTRTAATVLMENFGYAKSIHELSRSNFTDQDWEDIIYNELAAGRPILYSGTADAGHAFICHGYDADDNTFAINWGWGGNHDGSFKLTGTDALNPDGTGAGGSNHGTGYVKNQQAYIGISSDASTQLEGYPIVYLTGTYLFENQTTRLSGTTVEAKYNQHVIMYNARFSFSDLWLSEVYAMGAQLKDAEGHTYYVECQADKKMINNACYYYTLDFTVPSPSVVPNGTYTFTPAVKKTASSEWQLFTFPAQYSAPTLVLNTPDNVNNYYCTRLSLHKSTVNFSPNNSDDQYLWVYGKSLGDDVTGDVAVRVVSKNTGKATIITIKTGATLTSTVQDFGGYLNVYTFSDGNGVYEVYPLFRPQGTTDWQDMYSTQSTIPQYTLTGYKTPSVARCTAISFDGSSETTLTTPYNTSFKIKATIYTTKVYTPPTFYTSFKFTNGTDEYLAPKAVKIPVSTVGYGYTDYPFTISPENVLKNGTYQLIPVCRQSESDEWTEMWMGTVTPLTVIVNGRPESSGDPDGQIPGDIDGDNTVSLTDLAIMRDHLSGKTPVTSATSLLDVNKDGKVTISDITLLIHILQQNKK